MQNRNNSQKIQPNVTARVSERGVEVCVMMADWRRVKTRVATTRPEVRRGGGDEVKRRRRAIQRKRAKKAQNEQKESSDEKELRKSGEERAKGRARRG